MSPDRLASLSLSDLLGALSVPQLLKLGSVVVGLLGGAFGFGYWVAENAGKVALASAQLELAQARSAEQELAQQRAHMSAMQTKERILALIVLYRDARASGAPEADELAGSLVKLVMEMVRKTEDASAVPAVRATLTKGTAPSIFFEYDKSRYPLPRELFTSKSALIEGGRGRG